MNRYLCVLFLLCSLLLTACGGTDPAPFPEPTAPETAETPAEPTSATAKLGITLTAESVTAGSLTICCVQSGGEPTGELSTGSFFVLEQKNESGWEPVNYTSDVAWTSEAWLIPLNDEIRWDVDWSWLYGALPDGDYRIGKSIMDWRAPGDYDLQMAYAEFSLPAVCEGVPLANT